MDKHTNDDFVVRQGERVFGVVYSIECTCFHNSSTLDCVCITLGNNIEFRVCEVCYREKFLGNVLALELERFERHIAKEIARVAKHK